MSLNLRIPTTTRPRRHGLCVGPEDRRVLERAGWRTTLDYRENHVRALDGRLIEVIAAWTAEAERFDSGLSFVSATGPSPEAAWAALRADIEANRIHTTTGTVTLLTP